MTVTSQLSNITLAETGDSANWDDITGGPGSVQDDGAPIQGAQYRARRIDNVTTRGFGYDVTTPIDLSAENTHVGFWVNVLQPALIVSNGVEISVSDSATDAQTGNWDGHYFTSAQYLGAQFVGGWVRLYLHLNRLRDAGSGTINFATGPRNFGALFPMGDVGGTTPNTQLDRIDHTTAGVRLHGGTGGTPTTVADIVATDSGDTANRYGFIVPLQGKNFLLVRLTVEDVYADTPKLTGYKAPFCSKDFMGVSFDCTAAGDDHDLGAGWLYESSPGHDRQIDLQIFGTTGAWDTPGGTGTELRRIKLTSAATLGTTVFNSCGQIDPTNGRYLGEMVLPGTDEYVDTTTSLDLNTTSGDFEIIIRVKPADWTPTGIEALAAHYGGSAATTSFRFQLLTTGALRLIVGDGAATTTLDSSVLVNIKAPEWLWLRVTYDQSTGGANFFESQDPRDTPSADIEWTAAGTPTGTARTIASNSRPLLIGAEDDGTPAAFLDGVVSYFELWTDGFKTPGVDLGDSILRADWRTGPDFTGTPSIRADDFDVAIDWEEQGSAPAYATSDNNAGAADLTGVTSSGSVSESALFWNVNADPDGELDDMSLVSAGTGHGYQFGPLTPASITLRGVSVSGYAGSDGSTGNETIFNDSGKELTINLVGTSGTFSIRNGTGATTIVVADPVTLTVNTIDGDDLSDIQGVIVIVWAAAGGDMKADAAITSITQTGGTATVTTTAPHGLANNDVALIEGATLEDYNGPKVVTVTGASEFEYTILNNPTSPAVGDPALIFSEVIINNALTNGSGVVTDTRTYTNPQPITGRAKKGTSAPVYKETQIVGTVSDTAATTLTAPMPPD